LLRRILQELSIVVFASLQSTV